MDFNTAPAVLLDKEEPAVCRAFFKIKESLHYIALNEYVRAKAQRGSGGRVHLNIIDVGASPGGWTNLMADIGPALSGIQLEPAGGATGEAGGATGEATMTTTAVVAIDPGEMDPQVTRAECIGYIEEEARWIRR
jgi:hypothetical protein